MKQVTSEEIHAIYCADNSAGEWHRHAENYRAGFRAGQRHTISALATAQQDRDEWRESTELANVRFQRAEAQLAAAQGQSHIGTVRPWGIDWEQWYSGHKRNEGMKLYAAPIPQPAQPERAGLTVEQIDEIWVEHGLDHCGAHEFARAIEAAHGIKQGGQQ